MANSDLFRMDLGKSPSVIISRLDQQGYAQVQEGSETIQVRAEQLISNYGNEVDLVYQPATSVPSTLLVTGGSVDVRVDVSDNIISAAVLELRVAETGGTNPVTPCVAPLMIDRVEWWSNGSDLIQTQYGTSLWLDFGTLTNEQMTTVANVDNTSASFGNGSAISASASTRYYIPLVGSWFEQVRPFMSGLAGFILCRVYFLPSVASGTGVLSTSAVILHLEGSSLLDSDKKQLKDFYASSVIECPVLDNVQMSWNQTFAPSTVYTFTLSGVTGRSPYLYFVLRSSESNASNGMNTFTSIGSTSTIDLQNNAGQTLLGTGPVVYNLLRYVDYVKHFPSLLTNNLPVVVMTFGNPIQALKGIQDHFLPMDTTQKLQLSLDGSISSATYTGHLYAKVYKHHHISKGRIIVRSI